MDLNKQALLNLMSYPNEISENEITGLAEAIGNYPYFQLGHSLLAKATHDKQAPDAYSRLSKAAIYAPNRRKLRELFYEDLHISTHAASLPTSHEEVNEERAQDPTIVDEHIVSTPEVYHLPIEAEENTLNGIQEDEVIQSDEVYNELEENLRKLRESKNKFSEEEKDKKKIVDETEVSEHQRNSNEDKSIQEQDRDLPTILKELNPDEEVIRPVGANQQLQNELIDKFINSQDVNLRIKPAQDTDNAAEDLSYSSTEMSESLISENLAEIYVKQGKKGKAIEIYQKLIWKFPQKKAYFAEIIESLKAE